MIIYDNIIYDHFIMYSRWLKGHSNILIFINIIFIIIIAMKFKSGNIILHFLL